MKINHPIDPYKWNNLLYRVDCKYALQHLIDNKIQVDLIYLDPPFNSNRNYNIIYQAPSAKKYNSRAIQKAFHDMWTMTCQTRQLVLDFQQTLDTTEEISPLVKTFLNAWIEPFLKDGKKDSAMIVYLIYMTERLLLMKKVLKETGSIYLHCDPTASHYLKIIMDGIWGRENFQNEIIWCYKERELNKRRYNKKHDVILFYSKGKKFFFDWERIASPYSDNTLKKFRYLDKNGKYQIRGKGIKGSPVYKADGLNSEHEKLHPGLTYRQYIGVGVPPRDWIELSILNKASKERLGYPTQKPLALLERIIKASCPQDGIVLDPFCGCGTTLASAISQKIKWIGVDISNNAIEVMKNRIHEIDAGLDTQEKKYQFIQGNPETFCEYEKLNPYEKQEWLINTIGGFCNPSKSGDGGVDGDMTVHGGFDKEGQDIWHKAVFSVKTGKQCKPEFIRELLGTMKIHNGTYGGLILDEDPSDSMMLTAASKKVLKYQYAEELPPQYFNTVQILTSQQIIDGAKFDLPPTIHKIKSYRQEQKLF